jgi:23S rRNA (cytosine1962-C5)-methyltransferase
MPNFPKIFLYDKKIDAVKRFHPWIFSGAIARVEEGIQEGAIVEVYSNRGEYLALGIYNPSNIAVKILSFQKITDLDALFLERFQRAYRLREQLGLTENPETNAYRLINAEGDGIPSLIVDWYNGTAVVQVYSIGLRSRLDSIASCLQTLYGNRLHTIYDKSATVMAKTSMPSENSYLFGEKGSTEVCEYGNRFRIDWEEGQKTGFFLDQRENRALLRQYVQEKRVLNTFCYSGGFSIYALRSDAALVHSVDSSKGAIDLLAQNITLNDCEESRHQAYTIDVFNFLRDCEPEYDTIVLDPPAFAKSIRSRHQAATAYRRLNHQAILKIRPNGILFTFSCSQVVSEEQFTGAVTAAAIEAGREVRILHRLTQAADHPTSLFHPEGSYLKGLVLAID